MFASIRRKVNEVEYALACHTWVRMPPIPANNTSCQWRSSSTRKVNTFRLVTQIITLDDSNMQPIFANNSTKCYFSLLNRWINPFGIKRYRPHRKHITTKAGWFQAIQFHRNSKTLSGIGPLFVLLGAVFNLNMGCCYVSATVMLILLSKQMWNESWEIFQI